MTIETIELRQRLGLTKPATATCCRRCNAAEAELRKLVKDMATSELIAANPTTMRTLRHWGWQVNGALQRVLKTPCESNEPAWGRALRGLADAENAIGELVDAGHLPQAAAKMVNAGIGLAGDNFRAAQALAECEKEDFEDGAPPYSLEW